MMTPDSERLIGEMHADVRNLVLDVKGIRDNIGKLFDQTGDLRHDVDVLTTQHEARIKSGAQCNQTVNVPSVPKMMMALISGGTSVGALALFVVILLILKKWGLL